MPGAVSTRLANCSGQAPRQVTSRDSDPVDVARAHQRLGEQAAPMHLCKL